MLDHQRHCLFWIKDQKLICYSSPSNSCYGYKKQQHTKTSCHQIYGLLIEFSKDSLRQIWPSLRWCCGWMIIKLFSMPQGVNTRTNMTRNRERRSITISTTISLFFNVLGLETKSLRAQKFLSNMLCSMHQFKVYSRAFVSIRWCCTPFEPNLTVGPAPGTQRDIGKARTLLRSIPIK